MKDTVLFNRNGTWYCTRLQAWKRYVNTELAFTKFLNECGDKLPILTPKDFKWETK